MLKVEQDLRSCSTDVQSNNTSTVLHWYQSGSFHCNWPGKQNTLHCGIFYISTLLQLTFTFIQSLLFCRFSGSPRWPRLPWSVVVERFTFLAIVSCCIVGTLTLAVHLLKEGSTRIQSRISILLTQRENNLILGLYQKPTTGGVGVKTWEKYTTSSFSYLLFCLWWISYNRWGHYLGRVIKATAFNMNSCLWLQCSMPKWQIGIENLKHTIQSWIYELFWKVYFSFIF